MDQQIISDVRQWLDDVVIGLNLCPFAAKPRAEDRVRICVSHATTDEALLDDMQAELERLSDTPASELETTVLAIPDMLSDFEDYNQFLDLVDLWLQQFGWEGELQVASFHPDYQFADTEADDAGNLTNRSPWPLLHMIREESLEHALAHFPDPEGIPERNVLRMEQLSEDERKRLFPYLFG
ncbi:MAG: DUF1415 domain-containing protein [Betaproteobacteria bacterium HGW-Betaproteobacteria-13]|jgi:hypothetical protein|uniref:DUF1415 domain-containing protein n=1 Tax=Parazoarcus communis TaxID=41977 RepID=A0A2U8GQ55_9RHOO|nr:DUF1415 domain-containing protein [Parazoarcus communis]AWI75323.1 hypothetical protein CEW83_08950 [Parazoarcus communis]AWI81728.1 hypothetical protein CEW87_21660 [Parazoarcus communis]PKO80915.1 MAG: DUF1415 domain-containing protein [Betaproteobacteria bacterium HGW-Betaproteobacteria-13]|tara:strand:+ start:35058 stop:35603 length:546 start_codon:yes stop_codon:yes gene_type:complete